MVAQHPANHIIADVVPGVAHVAVGVDRGAAGVPGDVVALARDKLLLCHTQKYQLAGEAVLELQARRVGLLHDSQNSDIIINVEYFGD